MKRQNMLWLCLLMVCPALWAQNTPPLASLEIGGVITQSACALSPLTANPDNTYVVNLPEMQTTVLINAAYSPITTVQLRFNVDQALISCLNATASQLVFDTGMAATVTQSGLLKNSASQRPAQNMFVQLGLIGQDGVFKPLDLNQPETLNKALNDAFSQATGKPMLNLGVRYVAARVLADQTPILASLQPGQGDVTAGNISVYLPFILKIN